MKISRIKRIFLPFIISVLSFVLVPAMGLAHHSTASFSNTVLELEGTLRQVHWRNPHPGLTVQLTGTGELWNIQLPGTVRSLAAKDISASTFAAGQTIKIAGYAASQSENYLQGIAVLLPDGTQLALEQNLQHPWNQTTQTINALAMTNAEMVQEESASLADTFKFFMLLGIVACLISVAGIKYAGKKSLQISV